ncbi:hypothetical protein E2562_014772 [Oryza meyeriana var. granulata]|uniref:Uncharacterized protein n=1 Tax=Oryza meyeriana var. granulata TaxID=110450 RepID=A0A6G1BJP8_9ORYZ|nr:hypothetical protein E2562_014772 [Oryza meyeriana var. granulata]
MVHEKEGEEVVVEAALAMPAITRDDQCEQLQDEEFIVQEQVDALLVPEVVEMDQVPEEEGDHDLAVGEVVTDMMRKEEEEGVDELVLEDEEPFQMSSLADQFLLND